MCLLSIYLMHQFTAELNTNVFIYIGVDFNLFFCCTGVPECTYTEILDKNEESPPLSSRSLKNHFSSGLHWACGLGCKLSIYKSELAKRGKKSHHVTVFQY